VVADTYSTDGIGVLLMGTGNDNNAWGNNANANVFQILVDAIVTNLTETVTGGTLDLSGSPPPTASSQVHMSALGFLGVLASNQTIIVPNLRKYWYVYNSTSGPFTLTFKTPSGSPSAPIPQNGGGQILFCDGGTNFVVWPFNTSQIQMPDGPSIAPPYSNVNETNSGWRRASTQDWRLSINGADALQVTGPGAGTPNVFNVFSPLSIQAGGAQIIPAGTETAYAGVELPAGGWLWEDGLAYSRPIANGGSVDTYKNLWNAIVKSGVTCTTHVGSPLLTVVSADVRFKGLLGARIEGAGIPTSTFITSITSNTINISNPATANASGVALLMFPWSNGDQVTTFNVPNRLEVSLHGRGDMNGAADPGLLTLAVMGGALGPTSLGATFGSQTTSIAQGNLPGYTLGTVTISNTLSIDSSSLTVAKGSLAVANATFGGTDVLGNTGGVISSGNKFLTTSGGSPGGAQTMTVSGSPSLSGSAVLNGTVSLGGQTISSGGSNTPLPVLNPGAITNYIIKI
jgi:hypothetical protein